MHSADDLGAAAAMIVMGHAAAARGPAVGTSVANEAPDASLSSPLHLPLYDTAAADLVVPAAESLPPPIPSRLGRGASLRERGRTTSLPEDADVAPPPIAQRAMTLGHGSDMGAALRAIGEAADMAFTREEYCHGVCVADCNRIAIYDTAAVVLLVMLLLASLCCGDFGVGIVAIVLCQV